MKIGHGSNQFITTPPPKSQLLSALAQNSILRHSVSFNHEKENTVIISLLFQSMTLLVDPDPIHQKKKKKEAKQNKKRKRKNIQH